MNTVNFTGNSEIYFSTKLYKQVVKQSNPKEIGGYFEFKDSKNGQNLMSEFANTCTMFLFQAEEDQFMSHLAPEWNHPDLAKKILEKKEQLLKNAKEPLTVFIRGGQSHKVNGDLRSFALFDRIATILDTPDVDLSIIWGKTKESFTDHMFASSQGSKIILSQERQLGRKTAPKILNMSDLEDNYEIVEINPKHKLIFDQII